LLNLQKPLLKAGVEHLFAFGSRVKGDFRPDSDLDLFIDFNPEKRIPSLLDLISAEFDLQEQLGFPVVITTRSSLHPMMKAEIEKSAERVF
jgi:uncharacterized protein